MIINSVYSNLTNNTHYLLCVYCFCRDLHWGNILVKNTKEKHNQFILNGSVHSIETRGVHVNIIDYSLSRLEIGELKT